MPADRLLLRAIHGELRAWGRWLEAHSDFTGYPAVNILANFEGSGGVHPGHRVLMLDMPAGIWATHHRVLMLSETLQDAVQAFYVTTVKEDGTLWNFEEKAAILQLTEATFRRRLNRARHLIAGITLPIDTNVLSQVVSRAS